MKEIKYYAFSGCNKLQNVVIEDSHETLKTGDHCFSTIPVLYLGRNCDTWTGNTEIPCENLTVGPYVTHVEIYNPPVKSITLKCTQPPSWWSFSNKQYMDVPVIVPKGTLSAYQAVEPWKNFWNIKESSDEGTDDNPNICATPSIRYSNGKLFFNCATEGATCLSTITDYDITSYSSNEIQLNVTYNISVYATKPGYENSETVTATLCWIDVEPKTEGTENSIAQVRAKAVLIQAVNGQISITGADDGTRIFVYGVNGLQAGSAIIDAGQAKIDTNIPSGNIAIVKIGNKSIKVVVK